MHASNYPKSGAAATAVGMMITTLVGAIWAFVWYWLVLILAWLTCGGGPKCFTVTTYIPGTVIPILYLPFLTREIVLRLTNNPVAGRSALFIAIGWAIIFSSWLGWLQVYW